MPSCCSLGCSSRADYKLLTMRDATPAPVAAPNQFENDTYACESHVGSLLTFAPDEPQPDSVYWEVFYIGSPYIGQPRRAREAR